MLGRAQHGLPKQIRLQVRRSDELLWLASTPKSRPDPCMKSALETRKSKETEK